MADLTGFGMEAYEQFSGQRDANHFRRLTGGGQLLLESDEVWFVAAHYTGHNEQDFAHRGAAFAYLAFALVLARVAG